MELQKAELAWGKGLVPIQPLQGEGPQPGLWCQAQEMPAPPHRAFPHLKKGHFHAPFSLDGCSQHPLMLCIPSIPVIHPQKDFYLPMNCSQAGRGVTVL